MAFSTCDIRPSASQENNRANEGPGRRGHGGLDRLARGPFRLSESVVLGLLDYCHEDNADARWKFGASVFRVQASGSAGLCNPWDAGTWYWRGFEGRALKKVQSDLTKG